MYEEYGDADFLLTGATGFLGHTTLAGLRRDLPTSVRMTCISRRISEIPRDPRITRISADVRDVTSYKDALLQANYIVWMAASRDHTLPEEELRDVNVQAVRDATEILKDSRRLRRFVYVSSISAVDQGGFYKPIDDSAVPKPRTGYGRSKLEAENAVRASGLPATVLRLPFLYGPGFANQSFLDWYRSLSAGIFLHRLHFTASLSLLCTEDFAPILLEVLRDASSEAANRSPYAISDGKIYSVDQLIDIVRQLHGGGRSRIRFPRTISRLASLALSAGPLRYWRHAAFSDSFFSVDSSRFQACFPGIAYMPILCGLQRAYEINPAHDYVFQAQSVRQTSGITPQ